VDLPGVGKITMDNATGKTVSGSDVIRPEDSTIGDLQFVQDPVTGARFAVGGKGNFSSSGMDPARVSAKDSPPLSDSGRLQKDIADADARGDKAWADHLRLVAARQVAGKPMSATDWQMSNHSPDDYEAYY
jgi:hypothetical protein